MVPEINTQILFPHNFIVTNILINETFWIKSSFFDFSLFNKSFSYQRRKNKKEDNRINVLSGLWRKPQVEKKKSKVN